MLRQPDTSPFVLLETCRRDTHNKKSLLFAHPEAIISASSLDEVGNALILLDNAVHDGYYAAGYITYEAGLAFLPKERHYPKDNIRKHLLLWFGLFREPETVVYSDVPQKFHSSANHKCFSQNESLMISDVTYTVTKEEYIDSVRRIKELIQAGDTYQINNTFPVDFRYSGDTKPLYQALKQSQPVSYSAHIVHDEHEIMSFSPELFFRRNSSTIVTKPMKGTVHRGRDVCEDHKLAEWLGNSGKNRAENIMIVDMLRNDLGRICETGSVHIPELFTIEKYNTLFQMTSTVAGELKPDTSYSEIFQSLFPCGSITGAPKIRSMEIIDSLEKRARGIYTGAIGYISPHDEAVFNVAIRTLSLEGGRGSIGIGSGIVWDSDPENEYAECELKLQFLASLPKPFSLIETLLYEKGSFPLLDFHFERLAESADYFSYVFNKDLLQHKLEAFTRNLEDDIAYKVRLLLENNGAVHLEHTPLITQDSGIVPKVSISGVNTNSADRFLFHKTTNRTLYSSMFDISHGLGLYDVIFMNERGEITEGCIHNLFVLHEGRLRTPPVTSGLLNGVKRREILQKNKNAEECILFPDDIMKAEEIYLCNAVRGLRRVELTGDCLQENGSVDRI